MPLFAVDCIASVELHESLHHLCLSPVQLLFTLERKGKEKKKKKTAHVSFEMGADHLLYFRNAV